MALAGSEEEERSGLAWAIDQCRRFEKRVHLINGSSPGARISRRKFLIVLFIVHASMWRLLRQHIARNCREVERKLSNLVAHLA
jgi:hypothetical protein